MRGTTIGLFLVLVSSAASAQQPVKEVVIASEVPFSNPDAIDGAIVRECALPNQVGERVLAALGKAGIEVKAVASPKPDAGANVLLLEIAQAESSGNAFIGHHKSITVTAKLYQAGKQVASFVDKRNTSGGMGAGFKSSCAVLARSAEAIAQDTARWLGAPVDGARLGDAR